MLLVNVASKCGYTSQYAGLQSLHETYSGKGLVVVGVPCNQFGGQEPGTEADIAEFCHSYAQTSFPLMAKIDVNGRGAHPLFVHLKEAAPGILGTKRIKWNFTKFLVGQNGVVIRRYGSKDKPEDIAADIEAALAA